MTYDQYSNIASVTDPSGAVTTFTYDAAGNMIGQTDSLGNTTRFEYDSLYRLIKIIDPKGKATTFTYDAKGNRTSITDANGNTTYYEYNFKGQVTKVKDALGKSTLFTYGTTGCSLCGSSGTDKLTALTDANDNATTYQYDQMGRVISETDSLGNTTKYAYDAKGNLSVKTDANGNTITYTYDALNRLTQKTYPDSTAEVFQYDAKGNITYAVNQQIAYTLAYDVKGRLTSVTDSYGRTITYGYDEMGNRTEAVTPEGEKMTYSYDANNRLVQLRSPAGKFDFTYDTLGRRTKLTYPNGVTTTYSYDTNSYLTGILTRNSKLQTLSSYTYTHDNVGNRTSRTETDTKYTYAYDAVYQLQQSLPTKLKGKDKEQEHKAEQFTYDPVGNRLAGPKHSDYYTYNEGNQLLDDKKYNYEYDRNGNLVKKTELDDNGKAKVSTYSYDYENRLIKVEIWKEDKVKVVTFTYDPFGRRISKTVAKDEADNDDDDNERPRTTYYVYDNEDIILEYNNKGRVTARYVHGFGIDEPLAVEQKGDLYYYHADGLGSITALTDDRGRVVQTYDYDSFGNMKQHGHKVKQPYTYTGREWDKETGLYYYRARYYDSKAGKFISEDPIGFDGGDVNLYNYVDSVGKPLTETNPYLYTGNNPINRIDPLGLWYIDANISGGFILGGTAGVMVNETGVYPYAGGGLTTPGAGASITWSPSEPSPGWNVGIQGQAGPAGQVGYSLADQSAFVEGGAGWAPGASASAYYVWGPYKKKPEPIKLLKCH